jgi:hypothetical protein
VPLLGADGGARGSIGHRLTATEGREASAVRVVGFSLRVAAPGCGGAGATVGTASGRAWATTYGERDGAPDVEARRRAGVTAGRLVMLVLAVGTGWGAVTAAGPGHARDVVLAGPPAAFVTAAPAPLEAEAAAAVVGEEDASRSRRTRSRPASRSQDRLDPRFPSCAGVRAAGLGPYRQGRDTEYAWYADTDGDGVVCA